MKTVAKSPAIFEIDLIPVDKQARIVVSPGVHFEPDFKVNQPLWDIPPTIRPFSGRKKSNIRGNYFGKLMRVMGFLGHPETRNKHQREKHGALWLVRCSCGLFETRRRKSILNINNKNDCCQRCRHIRHLKRNHEFRTLGYNPGDEKCIQ